MNKDKALKNGGYTLVELIVVMAIASILVGGMSLSASLVFSKDAAKAAVHLNDAVYEARMLSMTRVGDFRVLVSENNDIYYANIMDGTNLYKEIRICDEKRIEDITVTLDTESSATCQIPSSSVEISFDKSKGNITAFNSVNIKDTPGSGEYRDGVITFTITQSKGTTPKKTETVKIVTATGKHTVGSF